MRIIDFVQEHIDASIESLPFETSFRSKEKNSVLTEFDQLEKSVYFIRSGVLISAIRFKEEDRVLDFHFEGSFCASYSSLLSNQPSDTRIICYTDCELEVVSYEELSELYTHSLLANQIGRIATERLFFERVRREKELLTMTAEERYQKMLDKSPQLLQRIAIKDLAKYFGVRPESLSRIRRK